MLDSALDQLAIEKNLPAGARVKAEDVRSYINQETRLWLTLGDPKGPKDLLGNPYIFNLIVDESPRVSEATAAALEKVVDRGYWQLYGPKAEPAGK